MLLIFYIDRISIDEIKKVIAKSKNLLSLNERLNKGLSKIRGRCPLPIKITLRNLICTL